MRPLKQTVLTNSAEFCKVVSAEELLSELLKASIQRLKPRKRCRNEELRDEVATLGEIQTGKRSVTTSVTVRRRRICASNQQLEILWNCREEILKGHTSHRMYAILRVWMEVSQVVVFSRVTGRQNTTTRRPPMHIQRTPHKHQRSSGSVSDENVWH